jgi:putative methionine-R-sulfoxide reductase with GAF domain
MARPSRTGGKMSAAQTRKASSVKGGNRGKTKGPVLAAVRSKRFTVSAKELREAREQQAATSEVLEAINRSGFDLDEILQTLVSTAARLCKTGPADIFLLEGDVYRFRAGQNLTEPYLEHEKRAEIRAGLGTLVGRVALRKGVVHIVDALKDIEYEDKEAASANNFRSMLGVPLLRDGEPVGVFALARTRVEPFSESQIRLVTTFANQAVMAIENARLFNETQEALERQTATADILKVIASSPSDVQPVFNAIATNAKQLIGGFSAAVFRFVADMGYLAAFTPIDLVADEAWKASFPRPLSSFPPFEWVRGGEPASRRCRNRAGYSGLSAVARRVSQRAGHAADEQRGAYRSGQRHAQGTRWICRPPRPVVANLRRSSRHRHRERASVQRDTGSAGAADGDRRGAQCDRVISDRRQAGA